MQPTECALVVAVPLQRSEFMADYAAGTDFLEHFVKPQRSRDTDVLWAMYEPSAASAGAAVNRAGRRGVTVVKRGSLIDADELVKKLKLDGPAHRVVLLTRISGEQGMIVGEPAT